jgi:hypothetical protein
LLERGKVGRSAYVIASHDDRYTRAELEGWRVQLCRLEPTRALATLEEAELFLLDRGLLTLTVDSALPSLFGATHEQPFAQGKPGFGAYPKTKWWWGGALGQLPGVVPTKLHRGKSLYLSQRVAGLVDPLCRAEVAAAASGELGESCRQLVVHLEMAGPSLLEELKDELGLDARTLRAARQKLEARGAVSSTAVRIGTEGGSHLHSSRLTRWDQLVPASQATKSEALAELAVAGVHAAVLAPRAQVAHWFTWRVDAAIVDELVESGRLRVVGDSLAVLGASTDR